MPLSFPVQLLSETKNRCNVENLLHAYYAAAHRGGGGDTRLLHNAYCFQSR